MGVQICERDAFGIGSAFSLHGLGTGTHLALDDCMLGGYVEYDYAPKQPPPEYAAPVVFEDSLETMISPAPPTSPRMRDGMQMWSNFLSVGSQAHSIFTKDGQRSC